MIQTTSCILVPLLLLWSGISCAMDSTGASSPGRIEISFDYNRADRDYANNQFAVWLEDPAGNLVETLFVTEFTATRGWKIRKEALPTWRKKASIGQLSRDEIDATAGATPPAQTLVYGWDIPAGEDSTPVPGIYHYYVECNYYWEDTVLYKGKIRVGDTGGKSTAIPQFSTDSARNYHIIENVSAEFIPHR